MMTSGASPSFSKGNSCAMSPPLRGTSPKSCEVWSSFSRALPACCDSPASRISRLSVRSMPPPASSSNNNTNFLIGSRSLRRDGLSPSPARFGRLFHPEDIGDRSSLHGGAALREAGLAGRRDGCRNQGRVTLRRALGLEGGARNLPVASTVTRMTTLPLLLPG